MKTAPWAEPPDLGAGAALVLDPCRRVFGAAVRCLERGRARLRPGGKGFRQRLNPTTAAGIPRRLLTPSSRARAGVR